MKRRGIYWLMLICLLSSYFLRAGTPFQKKVRREVQEWYTEHFGERSYDDFEKFLGEHWWDAVSLEDDEFLEVVINGHFRFINDCKLSNCPELANKKLEAFQQILLSKRTEATILELKGLGKGIAPFFILGVIAIFCNS